MLEDNPYNGVIPARPKESRVHLSKTVSKEIGKENKTIIPASEENPLSSLSHLITRGDEKSSPLVR